MLLLAAPNAWADTRTFLTVDNVLMLITRTGYTDVLRILNDVDVKYGQEFVAAMRQFTEDKRYTQRQLAAAWGCSQVCDQT